MLNTANIMNMLIYLVLLLSCGVLDTNIVLLVIYTPSSLYIEKHYPCRLTVESTLWRTGKRPAFILKCHWFESIPGHAYLLSQYLRAAWLRLGKHGNLNNKLLNIIPSVYLA